VWYSRKAGLLPAFDRIYGTSAGALNGAATAAGQAAMSSTHYQDAALRRVIYPLRALRRRPIIDFDLMFGEVIARRKPLSWEAFSAGAAAARAGRGVQRQAGELQADNPHISQVAVPEGTRLIRRFERDSGARCWIADYE
jgi:hypothetical protein